MQYISRERTFLLAAIPRQKLYIKVALPSRVDMVYGHRANHVGPRPSGVGQVSHYNASCGDARCNG